MIILDEYFTESIKNINILQEQYYGGNKLLDELDSCFDKLIKKTEEICSKYKIKRNDISSYSDERVIGDLFDYTINWKKRPIEILKELFNINELNINFIPMFNALTIVQDSFYLKKMFMNKNFLFKRDKDGIKFATNDTNISINIGYQLLSMDIINGRIMTGILLHEMGHNFDYNLSLCSVMAKMADIANIYINKQFKKVSFLTNPKNSDIKWLAKNIDKKNLASSGIFYAIMQLIISPLSGEYLKHFLIKTNEKDNKSNFIFVSKLVDISLFCTKALSSTFFILRLKNMIKYIISLLSGKLHPLAYVQLFLKSIIGIDGKQKETFADNFATAYGYGKEIIQFQNAFLNNDLDYLDQNKDRDIFINIINSINDFNNTLNIALTLELTDPHPNEIARCLDQINYLKKQANNIKDKDKRKQIENDIALCEEQYEKLKESLSSENFKNARKGYRLLQKLNSKFGGGIIYKLMKLPFLSARKMNGDYSKLDILSDEEINEIIDSDLLNEF